MNVSLKFISCLTHPRACECLPGQRHITYSDTPLVGFRLAAHTPKILTGMHTDDVKMVNFEERVLRAPYSSREWCFVREEKAVNVSVSQFHHSSCAHPCTKHNRAFPQLPFLQAKTKRFLPGHTGCCCLLSAPCPETRQRLPAGWWTPLCFFPLFLEDRKL